MMKIAKQIAEEHYKGLEGYGLAKGMLENIVAEKLEPVRKMVLELLTETMVGMKDGEMIFIAPPAFDKAIHAAAILAPLFGMAITERGVAIVREDS